MSSPGRSTVIFARTVAMSCAVTAALKWLIISALASSLLQKASGTARTVYRRARSIKRNQAVALPKTMGTLEGQQRTQAGEGQIGVVEGHDRLHFLLSCPSAPVDATAVQNEGQLTD